MEVTSVGKLNKKLFVTRFSMAMRPPGLSRPNMESMDKLERPGRSLDDAAYLAGGPLRQQGTRPKVGGRGRCRRDLSPGD